MARARNNSVTEHRLRRHTTDHHQNMLDQKLSEQQNFDIRSIIISGRGIQVCMQNMERSAILLLMSNRRPHVTNHGLPRRPSSQPKTPLLAYCRVVYQSKYIYNFAH